MNWRPQQSALEPEPDFYRGREVIEGRRDDRPTPSYLLLEANKALIGTSESPIESRLGAELVVAAEKWGFRIVPQFKLHRYRYDFAIYLGERLLALIECDGREFHSTPAQLENDRAKDRAAEAAGTRVLRMTGRDIYRGARKCAEEIIFRVWRA